MQMRTRCFKLLLTAVAFAATTATPARAELIELAYYHLGESDSGSGPGQPVKSTVDEIGYDDFFRDMDAVFDLQYSDDTPPGIASTRSIAFDGDGYLVTDGTPWHSFYPGFRVGMEAFVKVDPQVEGSEAVLFSNGSLYRMTVGDDGFYHANRTPEGITPVNYGQWQHVAFWTTGSFWQVYVDGQPQFEPDALPNFNYGGGGEATVGADPTGDLPLEGLIDEYRVFTWTGAFNPADLLFFQQRTPGDVNEDGVVDRTDYDIWRTNVGVDVGDLSLLQGRALGDLNGDRKIDLDDFALIKANRTPGGIAAMAAVPEPATWLLLLVGLSFAVWIAGCRSIESMLIVCGAVLLLVGGPVVAQTASWNGGDGNWTDPNWSRGNGPNGQPAAGQPIRLPSTTGTLSVTSNLADNVGSFDSLSQIGGTLNVADTGGLDINNTLRIGDTARGDGILNVFGQLDVAGGLDVGYGGGQGNTGAFGELNIGGSARVRVGANLDTWWDDGALFSVTGPDADIEVGATFHLGTAATMAANINSDSFSTVRALGNVNFAGGSGTLNVHFIDGYVPSLGASWTLFDTPARGGQIPTTNLPDLGPGSLLSVNYSEGGTLGQIVTLDYTNTLNLQVNPTTGVASIANPLVGGVPFDIDGYIIRSPSGSLEKDTFQGLGQPGWLPGLEPSQSGQLLSETNFEASTLVQVGDSMPVGAIFDPTGARDLAFEFHVNGGPTLPGTVQFGAGPSPALQAGDADQDLDFDQLDLVRVQIAAKYLTGQAATWGEGDWDGAPGGGPGDPPVGDGQFNQLDIVAALRAGKYLTGPYAAIATGDQAVEGPASIAYNANTGQPSADLVSVPEPSTLTLAMVGVLVVLAGARRRHRGG